MGQGKRDLENSLRNEPDAPVRDVETTKADDAESSKADEDGSNTAKNQEGETAKKDGEVEAYELGRKTTEQHYADIDQYRKDEGLPEYKIDDGSTGTVSKVEIGGKDYFGTNSKMSPETLDMRRKWFNQIEWVPPKAKQPQHLGHAQSLTHAEAHSLMNAYENLGSMPKEVNLYVDRPTCNMCKGELPALMKGMGIEQMNIYSGGSTTPITIFSP